MMKGTMDVEWKKKERSCEADNVTRDWAPEKMGENTVLPYYFRMFMFFIVTHAGLTHSYIVQL